MSHLGRHRNDLATWRAYASERRRDDRRARGGVGRLAAARARPRRRLRRAARPEHLGLRRRRRRCRASPAVEDVVEALASGLRAGLAGRVPLHGRGARDRAGPRAARRHRHPPHARRQPQGAARAARVALGRDRHDRDVPARPARRALPLPRRRRRRAWTSRPREPVDVVGCSCGFDVLAPQVRLPAGRDRRHARVPRHGRLRGCVRGQLQRPAAAGDRARQRRRAPRSCAAPRRSRTSSRATSSRSGCSHDGARHRSRGHHGRERRGRAGLLPRPARPARDRRGRGRGPRARRDHRPDRACACATPSSISATASCSRSSSTSRRRARRCSSARATRARRISRCAWTTSTRSGSVSQPPASPVAGRRRRSPRPGAWNGVRCAYVDDPDGRSVELVAAPVERLRDAPLRFRAATVAVGLVPSGRGLPRNRIRTRRRSQARLRLRRVPRRAGRDRRPRRRRAAMRSCSCRPARQVALLPDPRARPPGHRRRRLAADRADAGSGRRAPRARRARRLPQLDAGHGRAPRRRDRVPRRRARPALPRARAAALDSTLRLLDRGTDRAVRDRRGALRRAVGPRLPARLPDALGAARALARRCRASRSPPRPREATHAEIATRLNLGGRPPLRRQLRPAEHPVPDRAEGRAAPAAARRCCAPSTPATPGSSTASRARRSSKTAEFLAAQGFTALPYHAGLDTRTRAREPGALPARGRRRSWSRRSRSAWGSTSPTCASSRTSTCRSRSRATTRRRAAQAATGCRRRPGSPTGSPTSCSSAR